MLSIIISIVLLGQGPNSNILFDATPPPSKTAFNRLEEPVKSLLEEKAKALASHFRDSEPEARRKAIRGDLYRFALARGGVSLPWKDAEIAYLDNLCDDAAKPYDVIAKQQPVQTQSEAPNVIRQEDFVIKKWHTGVVRGVNKTVWAIRDPDNPANLLVDVSEQTPDIQAAFGRVTTSFAAAPPPVVTYTTALPPVVASGDLGLRPSPTFGLPSATVPFGHIGGGSTAYFGGPPVSGTCVGGSCGPAPSAGSGRVFGGGFRSFFGGGGCATGNCGR